MDTRLYEIHTTRKTILHHFHAPMIIPITVRATTLYPALMAKSVNDLRSKR